MSNPNAPHLFGFMYRPCAQFLCKERSYILDINFPSGGKVLFLIFPPLYCPRISLTEQCWVLASFFCTDFTSPILFHPYSWPRSSQQKGKPTPQRNMGENPGNVPLQGIRSGSNLDHKGALEEEKLFFYPVSTECHCMVFDFDFQIN